MTQTKPRSPTMGRLDWLMLLALSALWGGSFFFFKVLVADLPPLTIVLGRVGLAALALDLLLVVRDQAGVGGLPWRAFLVMGVLNNVIPFALIVYGETQISSGLAAILNATTPIFTVLAAHWLTDDEKLDWHKGVGILLGVAGVAVLVGPAALSGLGRTSFVGEGACLLAAAVYAFAAIYGRRFKGLPPLKIAAGQITASTLVLIPMVALIDHPWTLPPPRVADWLALAGLALLSTALAYILYFRILAAVGATNLLLVTLLLPISALALGAIVLGERVTWQAMAGLAIIGLALAAIDGRPIAGLRKHAQRPERVDEAADRA